MQHMGRNVSSTLLHLFWRCEASASFVCSWACGEEMGLTELLRGLLFLLDIQP